MKQCLTILFLAAALMAGLTGCAGGNEKESAGEPQVKPQISSNQESQQEQDENNDEPAKTQEAVSDVVSQLADKLSDQETLNRSNKEIINIEEKIYVSQMTDVYMNTEDYIGRTISMEGYMLPDSTGDDIIGAVVRNTPGCCGDDGITGLSFIWPDEPPAENDWLRITGVLSMRMDGPEIYLVIEAEEVQVLAERGLEFVSQ